MIKKTIELKLSGVDVVLTYDQLDKDKTYDLSMTYDGVRTHFEFTADELNTLASALRSISW